MMESIAQTLSKKTWYRWSFYINIVLFFIIALFTFLIVIDAYNAGTVAARSTSSADDVSQAWAYVVRDIAFLSVSLALVFFQFFRDLLMIIRRSL
jgi:Fe2+ transport system protein B